MLWRDVERKIESDEYLTPQQMDIAYDDINKIDQSWKEVIDYIDIVESEWESLLKGLD